MINGIGYGGYIGYSGYGGVYHGTSAVSAAGSEIDGLSSAEVRNLKKTGAVECETCRNRRYQDGSDEADVSFKSPGHISPGNSAAKVMSHEQEHVANAYEKAGKDNGRVISANVSLRTAVCPECGRSYVAGGETSTVIKYNESNPYGKEAKSRDAVNLIGREIDYAV